MVVRLLIWKKTSGRHDTSINHGSRCGGSLGTISIKALGRCVGFSTVIFILETYIDLFPRYLSAGVAPTAVMFSTLAFLSFATTVLSHGTVSGIVADGVL